MLNMARNQFPVYYKQYLGKEEIVDANGYRTGSFTPAYGELQTAYLSVSPNKGTAEAEMFGSLDNYDRTMTTADTTCDINEETILWLDGADTSGPHNYVVERRAPWKNSISFAIRKVDVSAQKDNSDP